MKKKLKDIWDKLPELEHTHKYFDKKAGLRIYEICSKKFQETASIEYVIPILEKYYQTYGHRAILASQNKSIDWKAVSHALRAAYQIREILQHQTITFPLFNAGFLKAVKQGQMDFKTEVVPILEGLMEEIEELLLKSKLPEKIDRDYWNNFIVKIINERYF